MFYWCSFSHQIESLLLRQSLLWIECPGIILFYFFISSEQSLEIHGRRQDTNTILLDGCKSENNMGSCIEIA
uniref:Uncharacterized protein n=1 Tax=Rhizophora mucronata TaxID=61149 RepID=A0A2P2KW92_RHIMU